MTLRNIMGNTLEAFKLERGFLLEKKFNSSLTKVYLFLIFNIDNINQSLNQ